MQVSGRTSMKSAIIAALAIILTAPVMLRAETSVDPDADRIFRASCKYLAESKAFGVKVEVWKDVVLPEGNKIQTTRTLEVQQRRPDKLHVEVQSPGASREFWYENKLVTMLDRNTNLYGVMEVPETVDKAIDAVEDQFGIEIPLGDVLVADPYSSLMENVVSTEYLGRATVLGVVCHHLAFTGPNADCQIWIADGAKPLPRKIVINFKNVTGSPQVTQIFSDWDLSSPISDSVFTFAPPRGALKIVVNPKKAEDASPEEVTPVPASK